MSVVVTFKLISEIISSDCSENDDEALLEIHDLGRTHTDPEREDSDHVFVCTILELCNIWIILLLIYHL